MKKTDKVIMIFCKVAEVMHFILAGVMIVLGVAAMCNKFGWVDLLSEVGEPVTEMSIGGFSISILNAAGQVNPVTLVLFAAAGVISSLGLAMIFRNMYLIFKTTAGLTKFSTGKTPFQKDNIRMVREIGIFSILIPVLQLVVSVIAKAVLGAENVETSVEFTGFLFGLVAICLSRYFAYGMELEEDVEGLV